MTSLVLSGFLVFNEYAVDMFLLLFCLYGAGFLVTEKVIGHRLDALAYFLISPGAGGILIGLFSLLLITLSKVVPHVPIRITGWIIPALILLAFILRVAKKRHIKAPGWPVVIAGLLFFIVLTLRLFFINHIVLPPYSDPPIHYQIVRGLLNLEVNGRANLTLENIFASYYHYGFHSITAWYTSISGLDPLIAMPLLGQFFLTLVPFTAAAFVYVATKNRSAAFFSGILAAAGWAMPAFSINWGKYPALAAISVFPILLIFPLIYQPKENNRARVAYAVLLSIGAILIHTRITVCIALVIASCAAAWKLQFPEEIRFVQALRLSILFAVSVTPLYRILMEFYNVPLTGILLLCLLPFSFQARPKLTSVLFFYMTGLWVLNLPLGKLIPDARPLLDSQFIEITLYLPLVFLGGVGVSGLIDKLRINRALSWGVVLLLATLVIFNNKNSLNLSPDPCCNYATKDDLHAIEWIKTIASSKSLILIPSFRDQGKTYGTDAGIWVEPLTNSAVNKLPFNTNWASDEIFREVCSNGNTETYIYASSRQYSFPKSQLEKQTWLAPVFQSNNVMIFKVSSCNS
jgi:hypothetical protein